MFDTKTQPNDKADISMIEVIEPNLPNLFEVHVANDIDMSVILNDIAFPDDMIEIFVLTLKKEKCAQSNCV